MTDLFPAALANSPRLAWLRRHNLVVRDYQDRRNGGVEINSLNKNGMRFVCCNRSQTDYASGATEEEAEIAFAERYGITWWKLEGWNGAMGYVVEEMELA